MFQAAGWLALETRERSLPVQLEAAAGGLPCLPSASTCPPGFQAKLKQLRSNNCPVYGPFSGSMRDSKTERSCWWLPEDDTSMEMDDHLLQFETSKVAKDSATLAASGSRRCVYIRDRLPTLCCVVPTSTTSNSTSSQAVLRDPFRNHLTASFLLSRCFCPTTQS